MEILYLASGLLATRGMLGIKKPEYFWPPGLEEYLESCFKYSYTYIPYPYHLYPIERKVYKACHSMGKWPITIICAILNHSIDSFGYAIIEKRKKEYFSKKLLDIGIKPGPIYKRFKEDEMVNLSDGKVLLQETL